MTEQPLQDEYVQPPKPRINGEATLMGAVTRMKDVEIPGQRFEIDTSTSPITAGDLRTLMNLPYEVSLHEDGGKTILNRGDEYDIPAIYASRESRWMLHTHPFDSNNTMPSPTDVLATWWHDHEITTHMLVTRNDILTYRAPQRDPTSPDEPIFDIRAPLARWGKDRGLNLLFGRNRDGIMPPEQFVAEMRQFVIDSGMLVDETAWDDQAGLERVLEIIN